MYVILWMKQIKGLYHTTLNEVTGPFQSKREAKKYLTGKGFLLRDEVYTTWFKDEETCRRTYVEIKKVKSP
ncbi:MAG: hypothetical protein A3D35_01345 [Candidatus Staskawiczbacteria bacterium RIFCSPHIGHO2_02_FULL_34_9]|uniref:Uncharacterized protein n=1 Tax=Candidatus Staskawiczbacteria bacterium RIFCSPHIGHO2_02_FULL_34_9 TaxID=1802206 RepID=A0A1G2HYY3_9BACT|nr:MAG: hypothetical protein A3D35_01345 [Candidatus Staskawiczbacteria bacterium RIFCSPHIGHO2_02_FULL_34_9]